MLFKVDLATGNLQWYKGYASPDKFYTMERHPVLQRRVDHQRVTPTPWWFLRIACIAILNLCVETDLDGNIREGKLIYNPTELDWKVGENLFVNADNSISLFYSGVENLSLQPGMLITHTICGWMRIKIFSGRISISGIRWG